MSDTTMKKNIVLLGDASVGKTSLIRRFVIDQFSDDYITTIGTKVTKKELTLGEKAKRTNMTLMIWDIIGQKGYKFTQAMSFQGMHGALLVADVTRKDTLNSLVEYWIPLIVKMTGPIPMIFLGNKSDLEDEMTFGIKEMEKVAASCKDFGSHGTCYLTSAKTGDHVEQCFMNIASFTKTSRPRQSLTESLGLLDTREMSTIKDVLDHIIADFSDQYGGLEHATPVIKHQMELAGLDISSPNEVSVLQFVDRLAKIEGSFKSKKEVDENRMTRLRLLGYYKKQR
jgi:small GTP-binding protein